MTVSCTISINKFRPVEAEMSHADGQTDLMKVTVAFQKFAKAPNIIWSHVRSFVKFFYILRLLFLASGTKLM
jgi:hypothetical protein